MCQKSSRSLKPFGHNTPTLQTDGRISYGIGLDLTVGQKWMITFHYNLFIHVVFNFMGTEATTCGLLCFDLFLNH